MLLGLEIKKTREELREHMIYYGISLREMARTTGLARETITAFLSKTSTPQITTYAKIVNYLRDHKNRV